MSKTTGTFETKMDKARFAISELHAMKYLCLVENKVQWRLAVKLARKDVRTVTENFVRALDASLVRGNRDGINYIGAFTEQIKLEKEYARLRKGGN